MFTHINVLQTKKQKAILIYNESTMNFVNNSFIIDGQTFKYSHKKGSRTHVKYKDIKNNISSINVMNGNIKKSKSYRNKKDPSFYYSNFYDIYIYKSENKTMGYAYPVEKVWTIESKIVD